MIGADDWELAGTSPSLITMFSGSSSDTFLQNHGLSWHYSSEAILA